MSGPAVWVLSVPTSDVDADGNAVVVAAVTDDTTGAAGTVTVTLTPDRQLQVLADGIDLSDYTAWSTS